MRRKAKAKQPKEWPSHMAGLATRLKMRREQCNMSHKELAAKAGVDKTVLSTVEGALTTTSYTTLLALADALEAPPEWLFFGKGDLPAPSPEILGTGDQRFSANREPETP